MWMNMWRSSEHSSKVWSMETNTCTRLSSDDAGTATRTAAKENGGRSTSLAFGRTSMFITRWYSR